MTSSDTTETHSASWQGAMSVDHFVRASNADEVDAKGKPAGWHFKRSHAGERYEGEDAYKRFKGFEFLIHPWKAFKDRVARMG